MRKNVLGLCDSGKMMFCKIWSFFLLLILTWSLVAGRVDPQGNFRAGKEVCAILDCNCNILF